MTYFTSDQHWGHENIIKLCDRPFIHKHEMDAEMIKRWNDVVNDSDTVYHLGDFGFKASSSYLESIMWRLNGKIILIPGNHDKVTIKAAIRCNKIEVVGKIHEIDIDGEHVVLCHYPMLEWPRYHKGSWHLFGHVHGNIAPSTLPPKCCDVGVDVWDFRPITFEQIRNDG